MLSQEPPAINLHRYVLDEEAAIYTSYYARASHHLYYMSTHLYL